MEDVFKQLFTKYEKTLKYKNYPNKKFLITFAGVPGSGKTVISKLLEERLKAIRISSVELQIILEEHRDERLYDGLLDEKRAFVNWSIQKVLEDYENKLIILDKSIDRTYEQVREFCEKNNMPILIVSLEASKEELVKRLKNREGEGAQSYLNDLDRWIREHEAFKEEQVHDLLFDTEFKTPNEVVAEIVGYMR